MSTEIIIQWEPVNCIESNGNITNYNIVLVTRNGEYSMNVNVNGSVRETTISGLEPLTEYNVSVAAVNSRGIGMYSKDITIITEGK